VTGNGEFVTLKLPKHSTINGEEMSDMKSKIHWLTVFSIASLTILALTGSGKIAVWATQSGVNTLTISAQSFQFKGQGQEPVLEAYTIGQGGSQTLSLDGFDSRLSDQNFGGAPSPHATKSVIQFNTESDHSNLLLQIYRVVPKGTIIFALIVTRVEVRAFNSQAAPVYLRNLGGFVFGDGASGNWNQSLFDLPANVAQIKVTFFGNYE
jgi:hypothetical protein